MTAASASDSWRPSRAASRNRPALRAEGWISGRAPGERTWWASAGDADNFDPVVLTYPVQLDWSAVSRLDGDWVRLLCRSVAAGPSVVPRRN